MKPGDEFIHYTKRGGVNKGVVKWFGYKHSVDFNNGIISAIPYMTSTENVSYDLNGDDGKIYKITKHLTEAECELQKNVIKKMIEAKHGRKIK